MGVVPAGPFPGQVLAVPGTGAGPAGGRVIPASRAVLIRSRDAVGIGDGDEGRPVGGAGWPFKAALLVPAGSRLEPNHHGTACGLPVHSTNSPAARLMTAGTGVLVPAGTGA
jgi:hypothetical protein